MNVEFEILYIAALASFSIVCSKDMQIVCSKEMQIAFPKLLKLNEPFSTCHIILESNKCSPITMGRTLRLSTRTEVCTELLKMNDDTCLCYARL